MILVCWIPIFSCDNKNEGSSEYKFENIEDKINYSMSLKESSILDFKKLFTFSWDSLYIYTPYTPIQDIKNDLGFKWHEAERIQINSQDTFNLLVFTKDKNVVGYILWPRNKGDFSKIKKK